MHLAYEVLKFSSIWKNFKTFYGIEVACKGLKF